MFKAPLSYLIGEVEGGLAKDRLKTDKPDTGRSPRVPFPPSSWNLKAIIGKLANNDTSINLTRKNGENRKDAAVPCSVIMASQQ